MSHGENFVELNLDYAYQLASLVSTIIIKDHLNEFEKYLWFDCETADGYYSELLENNKEKIFKPSKETLLHYLIHDVFILKLKHDVYWFNDDFYNWDYEQLTEWLHNNYFSVLEYYNVKIPEFPLEEEEFNRMWEEESNNKEIEIIIKNYIDEDIIPLMENLEDKIVRETFYLLFNNKRFLFKFNKIMSRYTSPYFDESSQMLKRCRSLPMWLQKALFFRDNGVCQKCGKDLTSKYRITEEREIHFDHIIPLEKGGTNDTTNFQILCSKCNLKKSKHLMPPKSYYQYYW